MSEGAFECGPLDDVSQKEKLLKRYMQGSDNVKETLEKFYSKRKLQKLVEDDLSKKWIESNCKLCPSCKVPIEKNGGCTHMTCSNCGEEFDWDNPEIDMMAP